MATRSCFIVAVETLIDHSHLVHHLDIHQPNNSPRACASFRGTTRFSGVVPLSVGSKRVAAAGLVNLAVVPMASLLAFHLWLAREGLTTIAFLKARSVPDYEWRDTLATIHTDPDSDSDDSEDSAMDMLDVALGAQLSAQ